MRRLDDQCALPGSTAAFHEERLWMVPAELTADREKHPHRFLFGWTWGTGPVGLWVGINPSTATAAEPDPTILKWHGFARRFGWGGMLVVNPFSLRSPDPRDLTRSLNPRWATGGRDNDRAIEEAASRADLIVPCWGALEGPARAFIPRVAKVHLMLEQAGKPMWCLGRTKDGHPKHPLYLPWSTTLEVFR